MLPLVQHCVYTIDTALGAALHWVQEAGLGVQDRGYTGGVKFHTSDPVAPRSMPAAEVQALQSAVARYLQRPDALAAKTAYRAALGRVLSVWRRVMLGTYAGYDFDNFKQGGTILARGLYAAQTLRLFSLVPPADVFLSQAEEYYRDPKPVLAALQSWLCVPLQRPPCTKGHPFQRSKGGQDVVARPSAPKYRMLPASEAALLDAIAPHMAQHAQLLQLLTGAADSQRAAECLRAVRAVCAASAAEPGCAAGLLTTGAQCQGLGVGALSSAALLQHAQRKGGQGGGSSAREGGQGGGHATVLSRLQHRWNKAKWNKTLLEPGQAPSTAAGEYLAFLGSGEGGMEHPRGKAAYSTAELREATSWAGC